MGISPASWGKIGIIAALFVATFRYNLIRLWLKTNPFNGEPNWSHAILVPVVGLYYLFVHREELWAADKTPFVWDRFLRPGRLYAGLVMLVVGGGIFAALYNQPGNMAAMVEYAGAAVGALGALAILLDWAVGTTLFGLAVFFFGIWPGQNDYLKDMGMIATLFGVVLLTGGRQVMRIAWFPIVFLVCAIPWPGLVYSWVTEPLSMFAANFAVRVLQVTGLEAGVNGAKIVIHTPGQIQDRILNVAEACAGLRSLMTYISVAAAVAFLSARPLWQKLTIVASAVPIAITCNCLRISVVGELDRVNHNWSDGFAHQFVGLFMMIPAAVMFVIVLWVLDKIFIEEAEGGPAAAPAGGIVVKKSPAILVKPTAAAAGAAAVAVAPKPTGAVTSAPILTRPAVANPAAPAPKKVATAPGTAAVTAVPVAPRPAATNPVAPAPKAVAGAVPIPPRPAGAIPPRPAGVVPPRPAGPVPTRPAGPPAGAVNPAGPKALPRPAGAVPPRPAAPKAVPPNAVAPRPVAPAKPPVPPSPTTHPTQEKP